MITGHSNIEDMETLKKVLASEVLELQFALDDVCIGDEIDPAYLADLKAKKDVLEKLLKRLGKEKERLI